MFCLTFPKLPKLCYFPYCEGPSPVSDELKKTPVICGDNFDCRDCIKVQTDSEVEAGDTNPRLQPREGMSHFHTCTCISL